MFRQAILGLLLSVAGCAVADDRAACVADAGSYLSGKVLDAPVFEHGHVVQGVELSHTRFSLLSDSDGMKYDVAIDNIFANGFREGTVGIPPPLDTIAVNDHLELCGSLYTQGLGIHFVHTDCGAQPTPQHPDGWVRQVAKDGSVGPNMEANRNYCAIFGQAENQLSVR